MEIRELEGLEAHDALAIWSQCFEHGDRLMEEWKEWEARVPSGRTTYGIGESGALQAAFLLVDETVQLGADSTVPMSAVCGVGVMPASRGKGYATAGMRHALERMREAGRPISFLEPFSWDFYGKLGYAWTAPTRHYRVPTRVLANSPETERVRAAGADDRARIVECYTAFACQYRGMLARRAETWEWMFDASKKEHTYTYVYERDGAVEGYLIYHGGKREETRIDELIALTRQARAGLLGLLRRHEMQVDKFCWNAPIDDGLWSTLTHPDVETKLRSRTMARIVDVAGAFECITCCPDLRCALTLRVADEIAPWNEAPWRIEAEGGRVTARRGGEPQISVGVQALAQAYLGSPTVAELRAAGLIAVHDEAGYRALEALLAGPPAWCNDGF